MKYLTLASAIDTGFVVIGLGGGLTIVGEAGFIGLVIPESQCASTPSSRFMTSHCRGSAWFQRAFIPFSLGQAAVIIAFFRSLTLSFPTSLLNSSLSDERPKKYAANPAILAAAVVVGR